MPNDGGPETPQFVGLAIHDRRSDMKWHQLGDVVNGCPDLEQRRQASGRQ
jgi:hypothetical protein